MAGITWRDARDGPRGGMRRAMRMSFDCRASRPGSSPRDRHGATRRARALPTRPRRSFALESSALARQRPSAVSPDARKALSSHCRSWPPRSRCCQESRAPRSARRCRLFSQSRRSSDAPTARGDGDSFRIMLRFHQCFASTLLCEHLRQSLADQRLPGNGEVTIAPFERTLLGIRLHDHLARPRLAR